MLVSWTCLECNSQFSGPRNGTYEVVVHRPCGKARYELTIDRLTAIGSSVVSMDLHPDFGGQGKAHVYP